jgi:hypothetical protein
MLKDKSYEKKKKALQFIHWAKESKENRKIWNRKYRAQVRDALNDPDDDTMPTYKPSGGYLTW